MSKIEVAAFKANLGVLVDRHQLTALEFVTVALELGVWKARHAKLDRDGLHLALDGLILAGPPIHGSEKSAAALKAAGVEPADLLPPQVPHE